MKHGIINIHKEKGFTSHDVVAKLRGIVGQRKIGHTGTLDPDATGVLPVCLGKATKLCDMLTDRDKTYEAVLLLGKTTDTQDITGAVIAEGRTDDLDETLVEACIQKFTGPYSQIPPMYSALKVNGKKLYELAREGKEVERKPREVTIHQIRIIQTDLPRVCMEVTCSKGTYIRTLCHDIGLKLGCGGCMESLVRTKVSRFTLADSLTLSQVEQHQQAGTLDEILTPIDVMFEQYPAVQVSDKDRDRVLNGNFFKAADRSESFKDNELVRVYDAGQTFLALYKYSEERQHFKIVKMFYDKCE